ncbi:hypothetical protein F4776DRAFT_669346 [Hypoxylon sp. NC0597]|nr:hypothetical protein F4776DRAFT_669346 [Hypoxylon sp. NC0597]
MQFSSITTLFALAAVAVAAPAEIDVRTETPAPTCSNDQPNQVCCTSLLNVLSCVVGNACSGTAYCCNSEVKNPQGGLINLNLDLINLNCVKVL